MILYGCFCWCCPVVPAFISKSVYFKYIFVVAFSCQVSFLPKKQNYGVNDEETITQGNNLIKGSWVNYQDFYQIIIYTIKIIICLTDWQSVWVKLLSTVSRPWRARHIFSIDFPPWDMVWKLEPLCTSWIDGLTYIFDVIVTYKNVPRSWDPRI